MQSVCPLANSDIPSSVAMSLGEKCPFHRFVHSADIATTTTTAASRDLGLVQLYTDKYGDYDRTEDSARILESIGGGRKILELTTRFYSYSMLDVLLKEFFFMDDGVENAGDRLGSWIIQFMGGEGNPWDDMGRAGKRQETHHKAWHSSKREKSRQGRRFKLDDCRVWMRLMFLAVRDVGLGEHAVFCNWFVQFIAHFIAIYEVTARSYAAKDFKWSASSENVEQYVANGRRMLDLCPIVKQ